MRYILGLFYGTVYGIAHVVPGLSGGTFLVIFGCYDTVCEAFALNLKEIKKHLPFLVLFGVGTVGGLIGFVHAITFLFDNFNVQTNMFFMGLILGGIPLIISLATGDGGGDSSDGGVGRADGGLTPVSRRAESKKSDGFKLTVALGAFKPICALPFLAGLGLIVALFVAEKLGAGGLASPKTDQAIDLVFTLRIAFYSFIAAIAMVMPGISGAFILVAFGVYEMFIESLKELDLAVIVPAVIGILLGVVMGARLILFLLRKSKILVYSAIVGMVIGSVAPLFPQGFGLNAATFAGILFMAAGAVTALLLGKNEMRK